MSTAPHIVKDSTSTSREEGMRVAMRVVFPDTGDLDAIPIYLDGGTPQVPVTYHTDDVLDRRRCRIRAGERVSFGSYFNAFPAGYWRRWTVAETVRLRVETSGSGAVIVYKSNAKGAVQQVSHAVVSGAQVVTYDLSLSTFGDGGFYWFEIVGGVNDAILESAEWLVPDEGRARSSVTLGVTTFNRADYCVRNIAAIAQDEYLRGHLDELIIVDQGTEKVADEAGFDEVAAALGDQLRIIDQANLGGSGGFSRCMYEASTAGRSDYVILLDDDIILECESVARLMTFADMCRKPTIVGGHMFDMNNRDTLHTFGEIVNPFIWQPGLPGEKHKLNHQFARKGLRHTKWMHQRVDVDYNGWWMCLIPLPIVREIGLALPLFIKWDDTEYGLRAREHGYPTVSLPGACVWHVSWGDKDDLVGWQAYFHARNRLITAIMYSPFQRGSRVVRTAYQLDLKHLVAMQYYTGTGRIMALRDVLAGPDTLHDILPGRLGEIRAMAKDFDDARVSTDADAFPPVRRRRPNKPDRLLAKNRVPRSTLMRKGALAVLRQALAAEDPQAKEFPQERVAHKDNQWYNLARNDSAIVSTADGTGASWYKRDRALMRRLATETSVLHGRIARDWADLREQYRDARDRIASAEAWERTFGIDRDE